MRLRHILVVAATLATSILASCVGPLSEAEPGLRIQLVTARQSSASQPTEIARILVLVSAADMAEPRRVVAETPGPIRLSVPSGPGRSITVRATDQSGTTLYLGRATVDVEPGIVADVTIVMEAVAGAAGSDETVTFTVTYNANGADSGTVPTDGTAYTTGDTVTVSGNTGNLIRSGFVFSGWTTAADGSGTAYAAGTTFAIGQADVTLYARWVAQSYTVTYNANGADSGTVPADGTAYTTGDTVTVLGNTGNLVRTGYVFSGWIAATDGTGATYAAGATFAIGSSNVTLYAKWSPFSLSSASAAEANQWRSVTYGNGIFVAVAGDGTNRVMTSPDGITWTARTAPEANAWRSVTYGNGLFVAVAGDGTNRVMTSTDGITWTPRLASEANVWNSVTYGNGLFVAVANLSGTRLMSSPDGTTWTARTAAELNSWFSVTYGNGVFVALASDGTNRVMTSPDGITWTARMAAEPNFWRAVTYGDGLFVAVAGDGTNRVMTSPDGITWTARMAAEDNDWRSVAYGNGLFVAVAGNGTNRVMTSPDGVTWTVQSGAQANQWLSIAWGNGRFVAVSFDGTDRVMYADWAP